MLSCQVQTQEPPPKGVIVIEELGDTTRIWIRNNGIECWIYYDGEFIKKEKW